MSEMQKESYGIPDTPISEEEKDLLNTSSYINGLYEFVKKCTTPMSIALQGDWGTGKTSFINTMKTKLDATKEYKTIYFNTWQYSQFNMSEDLYTSFLLSISNAVSKLYKVDPVKLRNTVSVIKGLVRGKLKQVVNNFTGTDLDAIIDELVKEEQQRREVVAELKDSFAELVKTASNGHNLIIFVDDLDRLEPKVAVELLEVMKLFMDVEHCVFVLAIDYDVVVKGIRGKYGSDMSDDKCRSFFDKIIQLPFRMPVENYSITRLVSETFGEDLNDYNNIMVSLIMNTLGPNPRTFKRLYNSYDLLEIVNSKRSDVHKLLHYQKVLIFAGLVVQMASSSEYARLMSAAADDTSLKNYLQNLDADDSVLNILDQTLKDIGETAKAKNELEDNDIYTEFFNILSLTSITSVNAAPTARREAVKPTRIVVEGKERDVNSAAEAVALTFEMLLSKRTEKISTFLKHPKCNMLTDNEEKLKKSIYRSYYIPELNYDKKIYLGTSTGFPTKTDQADRLCRFLELPPESVVWYDGEIPLYSNK